MLSLQLQVGGGRAEFQWVEFPKMLCGLNSHQHLDTACYKCLTCKGEFLGWNEAVLEKDAQAITGTFNFRFSNGFTVDKELRTFVCCHSTDTTALAHQHIKDMHAGRWVCYATLCHRAALVDEAKPAGDSSARAKPPGAVSATQDSPAKKTKDPLLGTHCTNSKHVQT